MDSVLLLLWPIAGLLLLAWALRPTDKNPTVAPLRLALIRSALVFGTVGIVSIEVASFFGVLTTGTMIAVWTASTAVILGAAIWRFLRDAKSFASRTWRRTLRTAAAATTGQWAAGSIIAILGLSVTLLVLLGHPNNFDSQTYHLPRIEHWVQNGSVEPFATRIHRQVDIAPGAEYLLTHVRLIGGGDAAYAGLQFLAAIGCLTAASRITAQLGGNHIAQIATVFLLATTPGIILQATSTQVDLVAAAWVASLATVALNHPPRRLSSKISESKVDILFLGMALGLIAVTKTSGLLAAAPLLLWWGVRRLKRDYGLAPECACDRDPEDCTRPPKRARAYGMTVAASALILVIGLVIAGPFLARMQTTFGSPLGPEQLTTTIGTQTNDPRLLSVNLLKIGQTALDTPLPQLSQFSAWTVEKYADLWGVDVNDPAITFPNTEFPVPAWYPDEDRAALPITGAAVIAGFVYFMLWPHNRNGRAGRDRNESRTGWTGQGRHGNGPSRRVYALVVALAVIGFAVTIAWQPWVNRLLMFLVVLAAPMAGILAAAIIARAKEYSSKSRARAHTASSDEHPLAKAIVIWSLLTVFAGLAAIAGVLTTTYGFPHRLAGAGSVLTVTEMEQRFIRRPAWQAPYETAAAAVARRVDEIEGTALIGLVQSNDSWEYPWWVLLRENSAESSQFRIEALQSVIDGHSPASPATMDAIICAEDIRACRELVPEDWELHEIGIVAYALRPASLASPANTG